MWWRESGKSHSCDGGSEITFFFARSLRLFADVGFVYLRFSTAVISFLVVVVILWSWKFDDVCVVINDRKSHFFSYNFLLPLLHFFLLLVYHKLIRWIRLGGERGKRCGMKCQKMKPHEHVDFSELFRPATSALCSPLEFNTFEFFMTRIWGSWNWIFLNFHYFDERLRVEMRNVKIAEMEMNLVEWSVKVENFG